MPSSAWKKKNLRSPRSLNASITLNTCTCPVFTRNTRCSPDLLYAFFFFNDTAPTEFYTLSLHDALPISCRSGAAGDRPDHRPRQPARRGAHLAADRKSTRLNSSHTIISYALFFLQKTNAELPAQPRPNTAVDARSSAAPASGP